MRGAHCRAFDHHHVRAADQLAKDGIPPSRCGAGDTTIEKWPELVSGPMLAAESSPGRSWAARALRGRRRTRRPMSRRRVQPLWSMNCARAHARGNRNTIQSTEEMRTGMDEGERNLRWCLGIGRVHMYMRERACGHAHACARLQFGFGSGLRWCLRGGASPCR